MSVADQYPTNLLALFPVGTTMTVEAHPGGGTAHIYVAAHSVILGGGWTDVVILAGVNDIALDVVPSTAFYYLNKMYADTWAIGARLTGVSLTPWATHFSGATHQLQTVEYRSYCNANHYPWAVVNTSPLGNIAGVLSPIYDSGDGLHLNAAGNQALANLVYATL
jgi:lysophospholipase L1-like esterase